MSKTFHYAGTCVVDGVCVYKFANSANRAAELEKLGATCVKMTPLPTEMDKEAAVAYLATIGIVADKAPRNTKATKGTMRVRVPGNKAPKATVASDDQALKEQWAEIMAERRVSGVMDTMSFAEFKRKTLKWNAWTAQIEARLAAKAKPVAV